MKDGAPGPGTQPLAGEAGRSSREGRPSPRRLAFGSSARIRARWTLRGLLYAVGALAAILLGAVLQRVALVAFGFAAAALLAIDLALAAGPVGRYALDVSALRTHEGDPVEVSLRVLQARPGVQLQVGLAPAWRLESGSNVAAGPLEMAVASRSRGPQPIGPARARRWGPLGVWGAEREVAPAAAVEVVPRPEAVDGVSLRSRVPRPMQGRFQANRPGQGFDFFSLRDYQSGDTMRSVNWKASARREDLIVSQRQLDTHASITVLLDARAVAGAGPVGLTPLDRGCRLALGLYRDAVANRDVARFWAYGDGLVEMPPVAGDKVATLETLLARLPAAGALPCSEAWAQVRSQVRGRGVLVLVSTAEFDPSLHDAVADMLSRGHTVTLASPEPSDTQPGQRARRLDARRKALEDLRNLGAAVVDWKVGEPVLVQPAQVSWRGA